MVLVIITIVLIVVGFPLAAYAVEERTGTDSPTGAPTT